MPTAITIDRVEKRYPGAATPAVDGVSLRIEPGELFFLLGPSGCGKTTLLRMIAGFIEPTGGRMLFTRDNGVEIDVSTLAPNQRNTGMVFQSYALWPHMSVAENVAFGLDIRRVAADEKARRVKEALDLVQMGQYAQRKPNALSGGQQQRVALARALVVRPDVLLLDEPLSNLDAKLRVELRSEIRRICKAAAITTVYVTHDQKEALSMADRVAIMTFGKVEQLGTPGDLYRRPGSKFVAEFLGETNFVPGRVVSRSASGVEVRTSAGTLRSSHTPPDAGDDVLVSLRPEALRVASGHDQINTLSGTISETTYLGELAQHIVEVRAVPGEGSAGASDAATRLKVAVLNPGEVRAGDARAPVSLTINPQDVVLVPRA
jgi:iron(III) transport system ATP-binding protein